MCELKEQARSKKEAFPAEQSTLHACLCRAVPCKPRAQLGALQLQLHGALRQSRLPSRRIQPREDAGESATVTQSYVLHVVLRVAVTCFFKKAKSKLFPTRNT